MDLEGSSPGCSKKRKQPDSDEEVPERLERLVDIPPEQDYLNDEDDLEPDNQAQEQFEDILEAQESATIKRYGDIKVTPFNVDEEREEGLLDEKGNYIMKARSRRPKKNIDEYDDDEEEDANEDDTWLQSVDWEAIERKESVGESVNKKTSTSQNSQAQNKNTNHGDKITCFKRMLRIMKPEETVKRTIQRLGQSIPRRKPISRHRHRSQPQSTEGIADDPSVEAARKDLDLMIELADHILQEGDMDIYQKLYEDLEEAIN